MELRDDPHIHRITSLPNGLVVPGLPKSLQQVPLDPSEWQVWKGRCLDYRQKIRAKAEVDPDLQSVVWNLCADDPVYFCIVFGIIFEPRWKGDLAPGWHPWIPYPFQVETIRWLQDIGLKTGPRRNGIIEKARDMGASWMTCLFAIHFFLFAKAGAIGFSSRNKEEVDVRNNPKSLFTKLRGLLTIASGVEPENRLPDYIFPKGWGKQNDKEMLLTHPTKPITISGSTTTANAGRGDRTTWWFNDEAAFNQFYGPARASQVSTADHIVSVSSAGLDDGGAFRDEVKQAIEAQANPSLPGSSYLRLDWWLNPVHDRQWYTEKKAEMNDDYAFAREVLIDYMAGRGDWVYPSSHRIVQGFFPYEPGKGPVYGIIDPGLRDPTAITFAQYRPDLKRLRWIHAIAVKDMNARFIATVLTASPDMDPAKPDAFLPADYQPYLEFMEWIRGIADPITWIGDPYGNHRGADGSMKFYESLYFTSKAIDPERAILVYTNYDYGDAKSNTYQRRKEAMLAWLPFMDFDNLPAVAILLSAIQQARYSEGTGSSLNEPTKPKHDWTCLHGDTNIRTTHGWERIADLVGREDVWVWGYSETEKRLLPAKADRIWKSGTNAPLVSVSLDTGHSIRCTPDHRFLLRDGSWKEAGSLLPGDSLMPFVESNNRGYTRIALTDGSKADEHVFVCTRVNGMPPESCHVHHIDGNKKNNDPENLQFISNADHCRITLADRYQDKELQESLSRTRYLNRNRFEKDCEACGSPYLGDWNTKYCSDPCRNVATSERARIARGSHRKIEERTCAVCGSAFMGFPRQVSCSPECTKKNKYLVTKRYLERRAEAERQSATMVDNHKVRSVTPCGSADVFDISVPGLHSFVAEGVVVHNSHWRSTAEYMAVNLDIFMAAGIGTGRAEPDIMAPSGEYRTMDGTRIETTVTRNEVKTVRDDDTRMRDDALRLNPVWR